MQDEGKNHCLTEWLSDAPKCAPSGSGGRRRYSVISAAAAVMARAPSVLPGSSGTTAT